MGRVRCVGGHLRGTERKRGVQGYWGDRSGRRCLEGTAEEKGVQGYWGDLSGRRVFGRYSGKEGSTGVLGRPEWKKGVWKVQWKRREYRGIGET